MMHRQVAQVLVLAGLLGLVVEGPRAQTTPRLDHVRVIIGFRQAPGAGEQALVRSAGGSIRHTFWLAPGIAADVPQSAIQGLRNNPTVTSVDVDAAVYETDAELDAVWGVKSIGSGQVHERGNRGYGVKVCVIDSGVAYTHPDLAPTYAGGYDFVNNDTDPFDDRGHGSHVTGSLLAVDDGLGIVGVAPQATVLAYKILDQDGAGYISSAIAALERCITAGGQVSNSSFGTQSDPGSMVKAAYDNAEAAGLVNVAAAGNRTTITGTCTSVAFPARYSSVIAVTATDSGNDIGTFSCGGAEAELAAPGGSIYSTVPTGTCAYCTPSGYTTVSGTSMASPHVAGVAALVIASGITDVDGNGRINDDVRRRLQATADDLGTAGRDTTFGYGLVDADEAAPAATVDAPLAPGALTASTASSSRIDLSWRDNSSNETGFRIERCGGTTCAVFDAVITVQPGTTSYSDAGLAASTAYTYRVAAVSAGGSSEYSNTASATTLAAQASITLAARAYKVKGQQQADLSWSGAASTNVDVVRNGVKITTTANDGAHTDMIKAKGGGSYTYRVCEAGTAACSNAVTLTF